MKNMNSTQQLTARQHEVLLYLKQCGVSSTGTDSSVLHALARKGLVIQCHNAGGGTAVYFTWVISDAGKAALAAQGAR